MISKGNQNVKHDSYYTNDQLYHDGSDITNPNIEESSQQISTNPNIRSLDLIPF